MVWYWGGVNKTPKSGFFSTNRISLDGQTCPNLVSCWIHLFLLFIEIGWQSLRINHTVFWKKKNQLKSRFSSAQIGLVWVVKTAPIWLAAEFTFFFSISEIRWQSLRINHKLQFVEKKTNQLKLRWEIRQLKPFRQDLLGELVFNTQMPPVEHNLFPKGSKTTLYIPHLNLFRKH